MLPFQYPTFIQPLIAGARLCWISNAVSSSYRAQVYGATLVTLMDVSQISKQGHTKVIQLTNGNVTTTINSNRVTK